MPKKPGPKVQGRPDDDPTPALFIHCVKTYKAMLSEALTRKDDQGEEIIVWEGMFTALITQKLHLSVPFFSSVRKALIEMGCIRQLRRGGGTAPSVWELITEPTEELFHSKVPKKKIRVTKQEMMQEQINALNNRLLVVEDALQNIITSETE